MDVAAIFTGIAAILVGATGVVLVVHELRRRDRRDCQRDLDEVTTDLHLLRQDFADFRRWAFTLQQRAADAGADVLEPPPPRPLAPIDDDGLRSLRHPLRRQRRPDDGHDHAGPEH